MQYPDYHPASYFEDLKNRTWLARPVARYSYSILSSRANQGARYGDSLQLDQFADQLQLNLDPGMLGAMAKDLAEMKLVNKIQTNRGGGTLMCGSPNEVGPDPILDDYFDVINEDLDCIGCADTYGDYSKQKSTVWAMNVLEGEDQFCQRMAWSLYEHLNVGAASNPDNTESNLYTYDIMIRHCFGNYFDVIKEMTYSPKMAGKCFWRWTCFLCLSHLNFYSCSAKSLFQSNLALPRAHPPASLGIQAARLFIRMRTTHVRLCNSSQLGCMSLILTVQTCLTSSVG